MELVLADITIGKVKKPGKYDYGDSNKIMSFSANNKPKFVELVFNLRLVKKITG